MGRNDILLSHVADAFPLDEKKKAFLTWLASSDIQEIDDLRFWNLAFGKLLLDMGIEGLPDGLPTFVTAENLALIKECVNAFKHLSPDDRGFYSLRHFRETGRFRRFDRVFTQLQEQLQTAYPMLAQAIKVYIHENYYADCPPSEAGYHVETATRRRFFIVVKQRLEQITPESDFFLEGIKELTQFNDDKHSGDGKSHDAQFEKDISTESGEMFHAELSQLPISDETRKFLADNLFNFYRSDKRSVRHIFRLIADLQAMQQAHDDAYFDTLGDDLSEVGIQSSARIFDMLDAVIKKLNLTILHPKKNLCVVWINIFRLLSTFDDWYIPLFKVVDACMSDKDKYDRKWHAESIFIACVTHGYRELAAGKYQSSADCERLLVQLKNPDFIDALVKTSVDKNLYEDELNRYVSFFLRMLYELAQGGDIGHDRAMFATLALIARNAANSYRPIPALAPRMDSPIWQLPVNLRDPLFKFKLHGHGYAKHTFLIRHSLSLAALLFESQGAVDRVQKLGNYALLFNNFLLDLKTDKKSGEYKGTTLLLYLLTLSDEHFDALLRFLQEQSEFQAGEFQATHTEPQKSYMLAKLYYRVQQTFALFSLPDIDMEAERLSEDELTFTPPRRAAASSPRFHKSASSKRKRDESKDESSLDEEMSEPVRKEAKMYSSSV